MQSSQRTLQKKMNMLRCCKGGEMWETKTRISYITALYAATIYSIQNLADVSSFSTCAINLLLRIEESGSTFSNKFWLPVLVHQTDNLPCKTFAHISRAVEGLCISWSSLKAYRMKPPTLRQKQPWIRINNLHYWFATTMKKKQKKFDLISNTDCFESA